VPAGSVSPEGFESPQVGDLLILSEFINGGAGSGIKAFRWVGSGGGTSGTLDEGDLGRTVGRLRRRPGRR